VLNFSDINPENILSSSNETNSTVSSTDVSTGRQGEEFVYRILQRKYAPDQVKWINAERETGLPYDILIKLSDGDQFIEVKTTRVDDQNTFPISIGEVKCFLQNPTKYSIYRVHYSDSIELLKIFKIDKLEQHLTEKKLTLSMTLVSTTQ
jgi:hypothetical protein